MDARENTAADAAAPPPQPGRAREATRQRVGALCLLAAVALIILGAALPWAVTSPGNAASVFYFRDRLGPSGPLILVRPTARAFYFLIVSGVGLVFSLAPVLSIGVFSIVGINVLRRGRTYLRLDLVLAASAVGLGFTPLLLVMLLPPGMTHLPQVVSFRHTYTWGLWLTLTGYVLPVIGSFLVRHTSRADRATPASVEGE